jgi:2-phosphosulfolactate phosphatase
MNGKVIIDCFPESAPRYKERYAIVVIDVIRATTTITTAVSLGRRVLPVLTTDEAFVLAASLKEPLLVGELGGNMPYGFHVTNSPAQIATREDVHRPMIIVSSSGTQLLLNAVGSEAVYVACFRNYSAIAQHISGKHDRIAVLGAGTRGQFRREDQMVCAWVAEKLVQTGYRAENEQTAECISRWKNASPLLVRSGRSSEYLRKSGQEHDLEFILGHIDDLDTVPALKNGEFQSESGREPQPLTQVGAWNLTVGSK